MEQIRIDYNNKRMEVSFPYKKEWVEIIQDEVDTKKYDRKNNVWVIGLTDLTECLIPYLQKNKIPFYCSKSYKEFFSGTYKKIMEVEVE